MRRFPCFPPFSFPSCARQAELEVSAREEPAQEGEKEAIFRTTLKTLAFIAFSHNYETYFYSFA